MLATKRLNWTDAHAYCQRQRGANLAAIETVLENEYLEIYLKANEGLLFTYTL